VDWVEKNECQVARYARNLTYASNFGDQNMITSRASQTIRRLNEALSTEKGKHTLIKGFFDCIMLNKKRFVAFDGSIGCNFAAKTE